MLVQETVKLVNMQQVITAICFAPTHFPDHAVLQQIRCRRMHALVNTVASCNYICEYLSELQAARQMLQTVVIM